MGKGTSGEPLIDAFEIVDRNDCCIGRKKNLDMSGDGLVRWDDAP
jgi:hypothetical protein